MDDVACGAHETTLLQCRHRGLFHHNCHHSEDAGVRCSKKEESLLNISVDIINVHTVLITWKLQNSTQHWPSSYVVECFSERHHIEMSVNNAFEFSVQMIGLFPSNSYNCCVSALYESYNARKGACTEENITIQNTEPPTFTPRASNPVNVNIIGGVLGCIITILFILLTVCGIALLYKYLLRLRAVIPKR